MSQVHTTTILFMSFSSILSTHTTEYWLTLYGEVHKRKSNKVLSIWQSLLRYLRGTLSERTIPSNKLMESIIDWQFLLKIWLVLITKSFLSKMLLLLRKINKNGHGTRLHKSKTNKSLKLWTMAKQLSLKWN